jgi:5'-3' exonuclease
MRIHAVDGTYELFRAYYGVPSKKAPDGTEIGATLGLARSLLLMLRDEGVTHVGVAFDHVVESFRNELFDGYKSGEGIEPELLAQFATAEDITYALGMVVWPMVEFEADDGLATAAALYGADPRVKQVLLCTPDKDLAQCVEGERIVCVDRRRRRVLNEAGVIEKFGVPPSSMPDWLALVGDAADGIPGIPRWGARSAATLLTAYGHFESIPDDPDAWKVPVRGAAALAANLREGREELELYRTLATLRTDVPLPETLDDLEWRGARRKMLTDLCAKFGDENLPHRVPRWME